MDKIISVIVIGFIAQLIDGVLGMGYGTTSAAALIAIGFAPIIVTASVHASECVTSLTSAFAHWKFGNVRREIVIPLMISGVIGGILGAIFLSNLPPTVFKLTSAIILLLLGIRILYRFLAGTTGKAFRPRSLWALGLAGGAVDAVGGGWGAICTSGLVASDVEPRCAVGSVNFAEFFTTVSITITYGILIGFAQFLWSLSLCLLAGGIVAAGMAAWLCARISPKYLGVAVGIMLVILNARTILLTICN